MLLQLDQLQKVLDGFPYFFSLAMSDLETVADISLDIHLREQRVRLKDHSHPTLPGREFSNVFAMKYDLAGVGLLQAGNDPENRRLTASGGTEQDESFTFGNMEIDVLEYTRLTETLADSDDTGSDRRRTSVQAGCCWLISDHGLFRSHWNPLIDIKPVACKEQYAENQKREKRQHNRDGIRRFNLAFVEFRKNVEWSGLRASGKIARD